jgi:hypothetical protein
VWQVLSTVYDRLGFQVGDEAFKERGVFDVTTLYFEVEHEDELRKVGYSEERRVDPQLVVGVLVDRAGFPLEIGCYQGNKVTTGLPEPPAERLASVMTNSLPASTTRLPQPL